jgi:diguanylate cyclase (GGDEF)-like protein
VPGAEGPRFLLVEDSSFDARLIQEQLRSASASPYELVHVDRVERAREVLSSTSIDCVLLDLSLPDASGLHAVEALLASHPHVPVVVLSGADEAVVGPEAVHAGAQDYLRKGEADGRTLWRAIRYAVERKKAQLLLHHQAMHDTLTGLPNRGLFQDRLEVALARLQRRPGQVAVLFLDLDGFKWINDSLGHDAGDAVVIEVARRIQSLLRPYDTASRIGGDEFLVLAETADKGLETITKLAERIRENLSAPFLVAGAEARMSASIGVAWTTEPTTSPASLIRDADTAMYRAKALGKNRFALFDSDMREHNDRRLRTVVELQSALANRNLTVHYQPIVALSDRTVCGYEAMLHWASDDEPVSMEEFLEVLEEHSLVVPVGDVVLETALRWLSETSSGAAQGEPPPYLSVKVSPLQLTQTGVVARLDGLFRSFGLRPDQVVLELTNSLLISKHEVARARLDELKALGVRLAMDDYGIGQSTLVHLKELPFDVLKIDGSFISAMRVSEADRGLVQAIVSVGHSLGLSIVAEGVDDEVQAHALLRMGCEQAQGDFFGGPSLTGGGLA